MYPTPRRALWLPLLLIIGGTLIATFAAKQLAERHVMQRESAALQRQLSLYAQSLEQRIDRYRTLPQVLALDPELRQALMAPPTAAQRLQLNLKLERANSATRASTLTLIDTDGTALAASNWREPSNNVGIDYSYRPYVQQAMQHGSGHFYGIGMTTSEPGYFLSQAITDDEQRFLGVVVIKIALAALEQEWLQAEDLVLVSDAHGVVFLSSRDAWRYRLLAPLDAAARHELQQTRQYSQQTLLPIRSQLLREIGDGGALVRVDEPALERPVLWRSQPLSEGSGWRLHLLHDSGNALAAGRSAAAAAAGAWLALCFLVLFIQQRRRLSALRQRSRQELETVLQQHAQELRTAKDGILQAAQQADIGLSRSLQHLPQGVVIIDAELRIAAWNSRYIELFRFPAELVQVGRPIEDIFRYNARRGLLGPGPLEEAIARRLEHLRSGKPHMRESEKYDGTVLEIRGNPLPDGGFVTSYADITSYKATARELRSLADALEMRIAERTRDLEQARREAVEANRYKSRFVAAAVHDLLQPLNAARMFLSALRGHLKLAQNRAEADAVEDALAAQDAILNSLLDISRLESGTQQVRLRHFALDPLLDALAREFGILAQARGLSVQRIPTSLLVHSDEHLLRRVLQNLLSNAVRYTVRGRIVLGCRRVGDQVRIEVHDSGPGIPPGRQREIFEEFRRLDDGGASERGAGLGLAIVERIARLLGHPIGLHSQPGRGSVFSVTLPQGDPRQLQLLAPAPMRAHSEADDSLLRDCEVWCIDDDVRVREASRALLERWGCRVTLAAAGDEALAALDTAPPQLLLLDVQLGNHHGPTLYDQLAGHWDTPPQVILVTAERSDALRALAAERGWGFLPKPVKPPALRALMMQQLLRRDGGH